MPSAAIINQHSSNSLDSLQQACTFLEDASLTLLDAAAKLAHAATCLSKHTDYRKQKRLLHKQKRLTNKPHTALAQSPQNIKFDVGNPISKRLRSRLSGNPLLSGRPMSVATATHVDGKLTPNISPHFPEPFSLDPAPAGLNFILRPPEFGLIQERIRNSLFALVVQAILWNKTKGSSARPVLWALLCKYPDAAALAKADPIAVEDILRCLGLHRTRSARLIELATIWAAFPPCPERRYGRRDYPRHGDSRDVKNRELLDPDNDRQGWEIAHLPGVGEYALDSYRIFARDQLRGVLQTDGVEPEWKRVVPRDKELAPYVGWLWAKEGWNYDLGTGKRWKL